MTYIMPQPGHFQCDICGKPIAVGRSVVVGNPGTMRDLMGVVMPLMTEGDRVLHFHLQCLPLKGAPK